ncbi:ATP-binding protein [Pseudomonas petrae]|uniref:ATP-binding protein n=1 Tax=Pseudomonas petrae TaxID=2912190 RepID=A0ABS9I0C9_9PSED|nr:ATP-binding protein [Pseudomonas petrae]MCF7540604.1 ATP-binding protein [Pseudomonas petrae]
MTIKHTIETALHECVDHGQFTDSMVEQFAAEPHWYGCPRCNFDKRHSSDDVVRSVGVTVHRARLMNERLLDAGIPLRFQTCSLDTWAADEDQDKLRAWHYATGYVDAFAENFPLGRSVMLLGQVGTGKTHLAAGILQQVIRHFAAQGLAGLYTTAGGIIRSIKDTFGNRERTESQVYADLIAPHLLVIDEVGVQHGTDFERTVLFEVINGRYEQMKPTIVVSNLGMADLRTCLGDRAVDRLRDKGGLVVLFRWASARGAV